MEKKDEIQYKIFYSSKNFSHLPSFLFPHNFVYLDCYSESQKTQESREVPGQANIFLSDMEEEKIFCLERGVNDYGEVEGERKREREREII